MMSDDETTDLIIKLRKRGYTCEETARRCYVPVHRVWYVMHKVGLAGKIERPVEYEHRERSVEDMPRVVYRPPGMWFRKHRQTTHDVPYVRADLVDCSHLGLEL